MVEFSDQIIIKELKIFNFLWALVGVAFRSCIKTYGICLDEKYKVSSF